MSEARYTWGWRVKPVTLEVTLVGLSPSLLLASEIRLRQMVCLLLLGCYIACEWLSRIPPSERFWKVFWGFTQFFFLKAYVHFQITKVVSRVLVLQKICKPTIWQDFGQKVNLCSDLFNLCRWRCHVQSRQECKKNPFSTLVEVGV